MTATVNRGSRKAAPRKAAPRKAAPRKAAGARVNGKVNGHAPVAPPEEFKVALPVHPYGDVRLFVCEQPSDGGPPIVFPHISAVRGVYHLFWKIRKFKLSPMDMTYEWMDAAQVPDDFQERVVKLPDEEMSRFFKGWFAGAIEPPEVVPGES